MTRARRAAAYGAARLALVALDELELIGAGVVDVDPETDADLAVARDRVRRIRDRLFDAVRRDTDQVERLELEVDR